MIALSWSRLTTYLQCPRKFQLTYISKSFKEEEKSIHLVKGEQLHKQLEDYVLAKNGQAVMPLGFSPEVKGALPYVDKLFGAFDALYPEAQVAANVSWQPTEWFGADAAWRSIWDVIGLSPQVVYIGDYKSGKIYPYGANFGQLHLSAVMALERWADVPEATAAYIYIEHQKIKPVKVTREKTDATYRDDDGQDKPVPHLAEVRAYFNARFEQVQMEKEWAPVPNEFCKWCPATKSQCKFSRKL